VLNRGKGGTPFRVSPLPCTKGEGQISMLKKGVRLRERTKGKEKGGKWRTHGCLSAGREKKERKELRGNSNLLKGGGKGRKRPTVLICYPFRQMAERGGEGRKKDHDEYHRYSLLRAWTKGKKEKGSARPDQ